jgi:hypothetical protein
LIQEIIEGAKEGWKEGRAEKKAGQAKKKRSKAAIKGVKTKRKKKKAQEKEQRRVSGQDVAGRVDSWLKRHPKIEGLVRGSADDPENVTWSRLSNDLISLSTEDAYDFLDRLDKGGEVFFKGYIESFKVDLEAEREASELLQLIDDLSKIKV